MNESPKSPPKKLAKAKRRPCNCPPPLKAAKATNGQMSTSALQTFDRVEWLKHHVIPQYLIDRTVKLKYTKHISEMNEYFATKKVFNRFDDDGNRNRPYNDNRTTGCRRGKDEIHGP